jgi:beta-1,4-mannosyltransferase
MGSPTRRPIRVMQSFASLRPTSNPYIHLLDAALASTPGIEHVRFDRRRALLGRYDALHLHWPETLLTGSTRPRTFARRAFAIALAARLSVSRIALVRTVHNPSAHEGTSRWEQRYLAWLDRRTDHRIVLNEHTALPPGATATLIPHGHYRDWFAAQPRRDPLPATLAFVGLLRPYKGLEELLEAFATTAGSAPALRLRLAGRPVDARLEREIRALAARDARVSLDLRHLSEAEFANAVMESAGVVLPYRAMHNSGAALAALSLDRPVLVPRSAVTESLAAEVGPGWVAMFDGQISGERLLAFADAAAAPPGTPPSLEARGWAPAGALHREAFLVAIRHRRAGGRR